MSKSALKKELMTMNQNQLVQVILDSYEANSDFKEYFEFFLNPDVNKLLEKHEKAVTKEVTRSKYGYSKLRVTNLKKYVKKFIGFNAGIEANLDMFFLTLNLLGLAERYTNFNSSQIKYIEFLTKQIINYGNDHEVITTVMERLAIETEKPNYTIYFRDNVKRAVSSSI